ncbi:MAG TPA: mycofactocin precursor MftA [Ktedonobacteraceae bacterium]|jgi:mycofactocin precursor|nr:mycofactocin precursor MftA [Ktedonobacteraceae bacterium]
MPDTTLPNITDPEKEVVMSEPVAPASELPVTEERPEAPPSSQEEVTLEDGIEEELIIEDFTIDGICGVY